MIDVLSPRAYALAWTVGEQVQNGGGLGLASWRTRSEWLGARPEGLENKSKMVEKLGQGPAGCSIS